MQVEGTVFILGAGASAHCGLPVGSQLLEQMIKDGRSLVGNASQNRFLEEHVTEFRNLLRGSGVLSVDAFVASQPRFEELARQQIALQLVPPSASAVRETTLLSNWHGWFINHILYHYEDISTMPLKIVSFNYDRLFEYALISHLICLRGMSAEAATAAVGSLDIQHVYGELKDLLRWQDSYDTRCFNVPTSDSGIIWSSEDIRLVATTRLGDGGHLNRIRQTITSAKNLVFLGFGFDRFNVKNLGLLEQHPRAGDRMAIASGMGLIGVERLGIERLLSLQGTKHVLGSEQHDCEMFLRSEVTAEKFGPPAELSTTTWERPGSAWIFLYARPPANREISGRAVPSTSPGAAATISARRVGTVTSDPQGARLGRTCAS